MSIAKKPSKTDSLTEVWPGAEAEEIEVEIRPGASVKVMAPAGVPKFAVMAITTNPVTGKHQLVPFTWNQHVTMHPDLGKQLGIPIPKSTFYRLLYAGFIDYSQVTPQRLQVDLLSLLKHLKRTRHVPGRPSWWTRERIARWMDSKAGPAALVERDAQDNGEDAQ